MHIPYRRGKSKRRKSKNENESLSQACLDAANTIINLYSTHPTDQARIDALKAYRRSHFLADTATHWRTQTLLIPKIKLYKFITDMTQ